MTNDPNDQTTDILSADYLGKKQLAAQLKTSARTLDRWALTGDGPPATKIGRRTFYRVTSVLQWLHEREIPTSSRRKLRGGAR
jgi:hypothetical protein